MSEPTVCLKCLPECPEFYGEHNRDCPKAVAAAVDELFREADVEMSEEDE